MGAFDDLIPASQSANPGAFDDLIPAKPSGGLAAAAKQAIGAGIKGAGRAAADFIPGVTPANPISQYGQEVIDANPTAVQSFSDIADSPWTAVKEAVGNAGGSMAGMLGARALGTGITMAAPFTGPAAPLVGLAGQAIANVGPFVAAALPSYGGIREEQIKADPANAADAKSKAIAMLGAGAVGAIEGAFGPEAWALAAAKKGGIEAMVKKLADAKSIPAAIGKGIMRGGAIEGAEELVQNPIEQVASYQDPTTRQAIGETLFGGAMGAIGGGVMGGGMGGFAKAMEPEQAPPTAATAAPTQGPQQPAGTTTAPAAAAHPAATAPATPAGPLVSSLAAVGINPTGATNDSNFTTGNDAGASAQMASDAGNNEASAPSATVAGAGGTGTGMAAAVHRGTGESVLARSDGNAPDNGIAPDATAPVTPSQNQAVTLPPEQQQAIAAPQITPHAPVLPVTPAAPTTNQQAESSGAPTTPQGNQNGNQTEIPEPAAAGRSAQPAAGAGQGVAPTTPVSALSNTVQTPGIESAENQSFSSAVPVLNAGQPVLTAGIESQIPAAASQSPAAPEQSPAKERSAGNVGETLPNSGSSAPVRGAVGMMLSTGQVVTTASGRTTTPFPKVNVVTNRGATATIRNVDRWLLENAALEAEARGDDFNSRPFRQDLQSKSIPQASKDSAEEYLFGEQPPVFQKITRKIASQPPVVTNETASDAPQAPLSSAEAPQTQAQSNGFESVAQRQVNAADKFISSVMEQFGLSKDDATKAWNYYLKNKLVSVDSVGGQYNLKDGRLWNGDSMREAAKQDAPADRKADLEKRKAELLAKRKQQRLDAAKSADDDKAKQEESKAPAEDDIGAMFDAAMNDVFGEAPAAPAPAPAPKSSEEKPFHNPAEGGPWHAGRAAFLRGEARKLPSYFTSTRGKNQTDWFRGWDWANANGESGQAEPAPAQTSAPRPTRSASTKPATASTPKTTRTAPASAASAIKNAGMGLADVAKGLSALFKPKPGTLGTGLPFDEDTYAAAKPYFLAGVQHFKQAGADIAEMLKSLIVSLRDQFGMDRETIDNMKPYIVRFMGDVKAGKLNYDESPAGETNAQEQAGTQNIGGEGGVPEVGKGGNAQTGGQGNSPVNQPSGANPESVEGVSPANAERPGGNGPVSEVRGPDASQDVGSAGGVLGGGDALAGQPGASADGVPDDVPARSLGNYHVADPEALIGGSPRVRFARNKAAIETFQNVSAEGRAPTAEERDTIARFIGWGSFGQELFNGSWANPAPKPEWKEADAWLREHLGKDDWQSAQASIINAHYTDPPTVQTMWEMVKQMGFTGGRVLEPSMGIGNFFGMMPRDMMERSQLTGIEMESLTGGMAKMLYPDANIQIKPYQDSKTSDGFYDLVIGNWPFAAQAPLDRRYMRMSPTLHDYFFLKALDQVRAGGLVVGITSSGTMDKAGESARYAMARKADLIGAFRLPSGAFEKYAGTSVVTDILVFRKRADDNPNATTENWLKTKETETPQGTPVKVNAYFADNPQFVLGTTNYGHGTTRGVPGMIVDRPADLMDRLKAIPEQLPADAYAPAITGAHLSFISNHTNDRQQSIVIGQDNGLYVVNGEHLSPLNEACNYQVKDAKKTAAREAQIRVLIGLRKAYASLIDSERTGGAAAESNRKKLNALYASFVQAHGAINESDGLNILKKVRDPFYPSLAALEVKGATGYRPAMILSRPTMRAAKALSEPTIEDAFVLARNKSMSLDMEALAKDAKVTVSEATKVLVDAGAIFKTPVGNYEVSDVYLSGNVRRKLHEAEAALNDGDESMAGNIAALKKVIPPDEPYYRIEAKLGAPWVSASQYRDFVSELLGVSGADKDDIKVENRMGRWVVQFENPRFNHRPEATAVWGMQAYPFSKLVRAAMNNTSVTIRVRDADGNVVVSPGLTEEANTKIGNIREHFSSWVWSDIDRRSVLEKEYNEVMRAIAAPRFDGSFLRLEGMALQRGTHEFSLRAHQTDAIWRGLVNQMGIYAHEVGTGKTYTMAGLAVESRRYGLAKKPLIFAHNANSAAVAREFQEMYPAAKVLYIDNLSPGTIGTTMRQIANDDWDAVVVPHSLIERFALTKESLDAIAAEEITLLEEEAVLAAQEDNSNLTVDMMSDEEAMKRVRSPTAKELVKARNAILARIAKMAAQSSREDAVSFEDLGVDMVIVDEAHEFKKPPLVTRMKMKGLNKGSSGMSISLRFLTDYVKQQNNGKGVHLFTGTPITNTLAEIYNMQRYVADSQMQRDGIKDWDSWFATFADSQSDVELTSTGEYDSVTRLSQFINTADLRNMIGAYTDIVFADDMPEFKPRHTDGGKTMNSEDLTDEDKDFLLNGKTENPVGRPYKKIINDVAEMTDAQRNYLQILQARATAFKNAQPRERKRMSTEGHINAPILIDNQAPAVGLDPRLFDLSAPDHPNLKINRAAKNILTHFSEDKLATQVVFVERGYVDTVERSVRGADGYPMRTPDRKPIKGTAATFNLVDALVEKLVKGGIPSGQIAIIDGRTSGKRRQEVSDAMNAGTIRVVIGMTKTLGVGVNMQKHLRALHHLDAPWMPGDLEQRNGRGQRQGNQWNTLLEYRYITDRVDGRRWQVLAIKERFIKQFLKANTETRIIDGDSVSDEDDTDIMSSLSEAAGDPRIMLRQKLKGEVERLEKRAYMHDAGRADSERRYQTLKYDVREMDRIAKKLDTDITAAKPLLEKGKFSITIDGKEFSERQPADAAIKSFVDGMNMYHSGHKLGNIGPFKITLDVRAGQLYGTIEGPGGLTYEVRPSVASIESVLRNLHGRANNLAKEIEDKNKSIPRLLDAARAPFQRADVLAQKKKLLQQLEMDLQTNPVPPPPWLRQGAPVETLVYVNGKEYVVEGHQHGKDGFFVIIATLKGSRRLHYGMARDAQGMDLYEAHLFEPPVSKVQTFKKGDEVVDQSGRQWAILASPTVQDGVQIVFAENKATGSKEELLVDVLKPAGAPLQPIPIFDGSEDVEPTIAASEHEQEQANQIQEAAMAGALPGERRLALLDYQDTLARNSGALPGESRYNLATDTKSSPSDRAIYSMVAEGKTAAEILSFISKGSRRPFNRYLANALRNLGAASILTLDSQGGWRFGNTSQAQRYAAAYNPKTDTVALFTARDAERHTLHELTHAATLKAIAAGGPASLQMRALFLHIKRNGELDGQYGMSNLDEFVAEAFSNPKFQAALKAIPAPKSSALRNAWEWFVRLVANALGFKTAPMRTALDEAMTVGAALMRENVALSGKMDGGDRYAIAWHGTPHVWAPEPGFPHGRPRLDKMGTGEGNQAYGFGWYSAESRDVGEQYRKSLSSKYPVSHSGVTEEGGKYLAWAKPIDGSAVQILHTANTKSEAQKFLKGYMADKRGTLYQLDIPDATLPYLLDWDKPLSEQTAQVRNALLRAGVTITKSTYPTLKQAAALFRSARVQREAASDIGVRESLREGWLAVQSGNQSAFNKWFDKHGSTLSPGRKMDRTGEALYEEFSSSKEGNLGYSKQRASEYLASIGIVGTRYLDGQSRDGGIGTSNYVIWDQPTLNKVALLERNGEKLDAIRAADEAVRFNAADDLPPTITVDGVERPTTNSKGQPIHPTEEGVRNFYKWFGDSKVVDEQGRPLVVYHGAKEDFSEFDLDRAEQDVDGIWLTDTGGYASWIASGGPGGKSRGNVMDLYLRAENPMTFDVLEEGKRIADQIGEPEPASAHDAQEIIAGGMGWDTAVSDLVSEAKSGSHDALIIKSFNDGYLNDSNTTTAYIAFDPTQIKSATGNTGQFSPDNPDIRYNIAADWTASALPQAAAIRSTVANAMRSDASTSWLTPFNTQYHKAEKWAKEGKVRFKRVFDLVQKFLGDVSRFAVMAQSAAPTLFHEWRTLADVRATLSSGDLLGKQHRADVAAIASPLYEGTLYGGGNPMSGIKWSDAQLRTKFSLTDRQIKLYREALSAVNVSMDELAKSIVAQHAKANNIRFDREAGLADMIRDVTEGLESAKEDLEALLDQSEKERVDGEAADLRDMDMNQEADSLLAQFERDQKEAAAGVARIEKTISDVKEIGAKNAKLQAAGYFPLMRFGKHTVTATDQDGKVQFFGMYEGVPLIPRSGQYEANKVAADLRAEFPGWTVTTGIKNDEKYKLYQGLNIEAIQLFAEHMDKDSLEPFQEFIRLATNNRSAQRRLLHRQGTPGFDKDVRRTLAQFMVSNARATSSNYHVRDMVRAAAEAEKDGGDIGAEAIKLVNYVKNPQEEAQALRGFLFFQFLGGSLASAAVNLTQTPAMTLPFLSQYETSGKLIARLVAAAKLAVNKPETIQDQKLRDALMRAELDGVTAPQEIYQLTATASNNIFSGSRLTNALLRGWGAPFAMAERFNRRIAFISAFQIAEGMSARELAQTGFGDSFSFAEDAVNQTQGIYSKGNRMNVGRGTAGSVLMTFKQYSIMYLELLKRLPTKQRAIMVGVLLLAAGGGGLPGVEDLEDLWDTIGQWLGFASNSRRTVRNTLTEWVGRDAADVAINGLLSRVGIDLHGRMGMHNLIPGTGIMKQSSVDKGRDLEEFFGPAASVVKSVGDALESLATGHAGRAGKALLPSALRNAWQGVEMGATGYSEDAKGRRAVPVNGAEAAAKAIGFNPKTVADYGTVKRDLAQDQRLIAVKREEFSSAIADAIVADDKGARTAALQSLRDWNAQNPNARVSITSSAIAKRVRDAKAEGVTRMLRALPKGMRGQAKEELMQ